jgi:hypothetical protein
MTLADRRTVTFSVAYSIDTADLIGSTVRSGLVLVLV